MALGDYMGASCHACIGGTNVRAEVQKLQMEAPHIIVGTPGRVFDMLNRRYLSPKYIKMFVLDEADEMLSRGFKDQIYDIFQKLNSNTQVRKRCTASCRRVEDSFVDCGVLGVMEQRSQQESWGLPSSLFMHWLLFQGVLGNGGGRYRGGSPTLRLLSSVRWFCCLPRCLPTCSR